MINDITAMSAYCKEVDRIKRSDEKQEACMKCKYNDLCNVFPGKPSEIHLDKLGILYRGKVKSIAEDEIQDDTIADRQTILSLERLVERFELSDRKLIKIKRIIENKEYKTQLERLNEIARIVGE